MKAHTFLSFAFLLISTSAFAYSSPSWVSYSDGEKVCMNTQNDKEVCINKESDYGALAERYIPLKGELYSVLYTHSDHRYHTVKQTDFDMIYFLQKKASESVLNKLNVNSETVLSLTKNIGFFYFKDGNDPGRFNTVIAVPEAGKVCKVEAIFEYEIQIKTDCTKMLEGLVNENNQLEIDASDAWILSKDPGFVSHQLNGFRINSIKNIKVSTKSFFAIKCTDQKYGPGFVDYALGLFGSYMSGSNRIPQASESSLCEVTFNSEINYGKGHVNLDNYLRIYGDYKDEVFKKSAKRTLKRLLDNHIEDQIAQKVCEEIECDKN